MGLWGKAESKEEKLAKKAKRAEEKQNKAETDALKESFRNGRISLSEFSEGIQTIVSRRIANVSGVSMPNNPAPKTETSAYEEGMKRVDKTNNAKMLVVLVETEPLFNVANRALLKLTRESDIAVIAKGGSQMNRQAIKYLFQTKLLADVAQNAQDEWVRNTAAEKMKPFNKSGAIRYILCICYDMPGISAMRPSIQASIVDKEKAEGNTITSKSRIIFDSFSDNTLLNDAENHRKLICHNLTLQGVHQKLDIDVLVNRFLNKGFIPDKHAHPFLATFYVLYE